MLSAGCQYGVRASVYLARRGLEGDEYVSIRTIADELALSFHYLTKVLQAMAAAGVVTSCRGPRGGVRLARPAREITVLDLVEAIAGGEWLCECVLGLPACNADAPCALHDQWDRERDRMRRLFGRTTLESLARRSRQAE